MKGTAVVPQGKDEKAPPGPGRQQLCESAVLESAVLESAGWVDEWMDGFGGGGDDKRAQAPILRIPPIPSSHPVVNACLT